MADHCIKICLPSFRGLTKATQRDLCALLSDRQFNWYNHEPEIIKSTYLHQARDYCIAKSQEINPFIDPKITHFLFIDDDINGFTPDDVQNMTKADFGITAALYTQKANRGLYAAGYFNDKGLPEPYSINPQQHKGCAWIGMGFCLIKATVFRMMERPWFGINERRWSANNKEYVDYIGEDIFFCEKAATLGFRIEIYNKVLNHQEEEMPDQNSQVDREYMQRLIGEALSAKDNMIREVVILTNAIKGLINENNQLRKEIEIKNAV